MLYLGIQIYLETVTALYNTKVLRINSSHLEYSHCKKRCKTIHQYMLCIGMHRFDYIKVYSPFSLTASISEHCTFKSL